jgi:VWFA-related protein
MGQQRFLRLLPLFFSFWPLAVDNCAAQGGGNNASPLTLQVGVDEISLSFHASDASGAPLTHLTPSDLRLRDNGKPQSRIVMLESFEDLPIRAGFLFDTSASMMDDIGANRSVVRLYASSLLRKGVDRAFVMQFDTEPLITQAWTDDNAMIATGAGAVKMRYDHLPITSIFDSIYRACRDEWKDGPDTTATGNFILLFSDGMDDDSHAYLSEAVDMCQRTRTAIYAIGNSGRSPFSAGQRTLEELASKTGGRVFYHPQGRRIWDDLKTIEAEQRNQYHLVYKPSAFNANGEFHTIKLGCEVKGARIAVRSGYYAFARHEPPSLRQPR